MRGLLQSIDWSLVVPALILSVLGLATLFSISVSLFESQLFVFSLSVLAFLFFSQLSYRSLATWHTPIYVISIIFLLIVLGIGIESHGAVRWIDLLGVRLQFSEILKPFLALALAGLLANRSNASLRSYGFVFAALFPIILLIYLQPDLGNAVIYAAVTILTMIVFGFPLLWFFISVLPLLIISPIFWEILRPYQRQRIMTFFSPSSDPLGTSYNVIQAMIAVGSGMFAGKGLGQGTQSGLRFLPERHTDFIFATFTEGFGFLGGLVVLICFAWLCYRIYQIFMSMDDPFGKTFTAAAFFLILTHFFVNIGMNLGIIPIVGVTLPFVSYGGSSLLSNAILLGMLTAISRRGRRHDVLEIK